MCTSKGDDVRLGTAGAGKHKPIWIKGSPMVQNQRSVSAPHFSSAQVKSSRCLIGFDSPRTASRSAPGEAQRNCMGRCLQRSRWKRWVLQYHHGKHGRKSLKRASKKLKILLTMHEINWYSKVKSGSFQWEEETSQAENCAPIPCPHPMPKD